MDANKNMTTLSSDGATVAKIIATISVVLTHSYKLFNYMSIEESEILYLRGFHAFASCGVPVFFLLSGYFLTLKDNWDYKKNLEKKIRSLFIPYIVFILIYAIVSCLGSLVLPGFFDDFRTFTAYDWLKHLVGIPFVSGPEYYGPLWFVRELIIFNLLSFFLVPIIKKIPGFIIIPAVTVFYFLPIPQLARYSIAFFVLGMYFGFKKRIPVLCNSIYILILLITVFATSTLFEGTISWKIAVLLMTVLVLSVSEKLAANDSIKHVAAIAISFSFPIYLLHEYPMTTLMRLLAMAHISVPAAITAFFIAPILIIFICVIVIVLWKRLSPKSYSLCTGGR